VTISCSIFKPHRLFVLHSVCSCTVNEARKEFPRIQNTPAGSEEFSFEDGCTLHCVRCLLGEI